MKSIIKALALMAVFATANSAFAADKISMCQVSNEATEGRQITYSGDEIDFNVICPEDIQMGKFIKADAEAYDNEFMKWVLGIFGYDKEIVGGGLSLTTIFNVGILQFFIVLCAIGASIRVVWMLKNIMTANSGESQQMAIIGMFSYIAMLLLSLLVLFLHSYVRALVSIGATVPANGTSNTSIFYMAKEASERKEVEEYSSVALGDSVSQLDNSSENLIRNAIVEENTKYMCLQMKTNELARSDYLSFKDTSSTAREIYDNFQHNVKFVFSSETENGTVHKNVGNWNIDFEDYREDKYCSQGMGFDVANDSFSQSLGSFDNDDVAELIQKKGSEDGAKFMTPERITQQLSKYENEALAAIKNGTINTVVNSTDDLTKNAESSMKEGLAEVEEMLINEKVDASLYGHYQNLYINTLTSSAMGIQNNLDTLNAKFDYFRKHALYTKFWNCSQNYAAHEGLRFDIKKLNGMGADSNFASVSDEVARINWQCATINNGVVRYAGTDDKEKIAEFGDRALAIALAAKMLDSRIKEGMKRGAKGFEPKVDHLGNQLLALAKYGRAAFGQASIPYRQIASIRGKQTTAINNAFTVTLVNSLNAAYIDEGMLFGSEIDSKDLKDNPFYKNVLAYAQPVYAEALINHKKGSGSIPFESAKVKESSTGFVEIVKAFLENTFDYNESMKENLGMNPNLSYDAGYNECKTQPAACMNRYSGSLSNIVVDGGQNMFGATFKFYIGLELLSIAKMVGDLGSLVDIGFQGDNVLTKSLSKVLSFVGKGAAIIISGIYALISGFGPINLVAMIASFISGWIIPMIEPVITLIQMFLTLLGLWVASLIMIYKIGKSVCVGNFYQFLDSWKSYAAVILVSMFSTFGMVFVQWATKSVTVGHELRPLLGITSDVFLIGDLIGTFAIQCVALILYLHILTYPTKAAAIAESVTHTNMGLSDSHSQTSRLEGFIQGKLTSFFNANPIQRVKDEAAQKIAEKRAEKAKEFSDSKEAGKENKPRNTEAI
ncbi:TPA: hypothetical protein L4G10_006655 [Pseudomonas aeruginosa]|nr:hypothetical protein [Pseudomonas aeruginosa]HBO1888513.1 hypothetical protein [Pseudomonas aeruginosa]